MAQGDDHATMPFDASSSPLDSSGPASDTAFHNDTFVETESKSWLGKLMDAVVGVGIGMLLVIATCVGLFWNEGRAVQTARSLAEGGAVMVEADAERIDPAKDGKLVHVQGELRTVAPLRDPDFPVEAQAARLLRKAEMYQWKEESRTETQKKLGGGEERVTTYTYSRTWSDRRIDSGSFRRPGGHENPQMRYKGTEVLARDATLGAFRPGEAALHRLPADQELRVDAALSDRLKAKLGPTPVQVVDGRIVLSADPASPRIGDLRISYRLAPPGPASFVARQDGSDLAEYQTKAGDRLLLAAAGKVPAAAMFQEAELENQLLTWFIRFLGVVFMVLGWYLILRPIAVVGDLVPVIGSILDAGAGIVAFVLTAAIAPAVIAIAWLWYRPLVSLGVLAGGAALAFGLRELAKRRAAAKPAARAASAAANAPAAPA